MTNYNKRYIARFVIEAASAMKLSSGNHGINEDQLIATDANNLPYIPGTSIAGVLKSLFEENTEVYNALGYSQKNDDKKISLITNYGSRLIVSCANLVGDDLFVYEGLLDTDNPFIKSFRNLPIRQHVRINNKGAAEDKGKFDEQVLFKGTRFCFELCLEGNDEDSTIWKEIINKCKSPFFRLGGGTRKGFGKLTVVDIKDRIYDLSIDKDLNDFLEKSSSLNDDFVGCEQKKDIETSFANEGTNYKLMLKAEDLFLFSSGESNSLTDINPVMEKTIAWNNNKHEFSSSNLLIPATSVKGAILHRTAFHYNKKAEIFADNIDVNTYNTHENEAVIAFFGQAADSKNDITGHKGNVIFSDVFLNEYKKTVLTHVTIDRFTGGNINGALFNEEVPTTDRVIELNLFVDDKEIDDDDNILRPALVSALKDICTGMLPLGGGVMRGHGCFEGKLFKGKEEISLW